MALPQFTHPMSLRHVVSEVMLIMSFLSPAAGALPPHCTSPRADPLAAALVSPGTACPPSGDQPEHHATSCSTSWTPAALGTCVALGPSQAHGLVTEATGESNVPRVWWRGKTPCGGEGEEGAALPGGVFLHSLKATETCCAGFGAGGSAGAAELR